MSSGFTSWLTAAVFISLSVEAQDTRSVHTIGFLSFTHQQSIAHLAKALEGSLRELGYIEGRNVSFERRFADGKPEQLPALAADLVQRKVSVIVAYGATSARAAKSATATIPVVMMVHPDPISAGLVASMAKPGGNVTGLARLSQELSAKRLELLHEAVPGLSAAAVLWHRGSRDGERSVQEIEAAARSLGMQLQVLGVDGPADFESAFAAMKDRRAPAVVIVPSTMLFDYRAAIAGLVVKHRLPAIFPDSEFVEAGGLMSYGARLSSEFQRAAVYVDKILKGAKPGDLPIEQPAKLELAINVKAAKALGLAIPGSLLLRADQVFD